MKKGQMKGVKFFKLFFCNRQLPDMEWYMAKMLFPTPFDSLHPVKKESFHHTCAYLHTEVFVGPRQGIQGAGDELARL